MNQSKKKIYIYPNHISQYQDGANNYIRKLVSHLGKRNHVYSRPTRFGLLHVLTKVFRCDVVYFNWIEDLPDRRFGTFQVFFLLILLMACKISRVKIVWFVHNNLSHNPGREFLKKLVVVMMCRFSDVIISHLPYLPFKIPEDRFYHFDHPIDEYKAIKGSSSHYEYDILIWGSVSPYKGIVEFLEYSKQSDILCQYRIMIAGAFSSKEYYERAIGLAHGNIEIRNEKLSEPELQRLFSISKYVLFTYNTKSILSSASLCKSLAYGKQIIGPEVGSFAVLGQRGLIYTYQNFDQLESLLVKLQGTGESIDERLLSNYARDTSWKHFTSFLQSALSLDQ